MINAEEQRKIFWNLFDKILIENGEPFKINYIKSGEYNSWANVNRNNSWNKNAIDISFLQRKGLLRVDLYIQRGTDTPIGRKILNNKDDINSMITIPLKWESGTRNNKTIRPSVYFSFIKNDVEDYRRVIEKSLPTIIEFIDVANKYGKYEFFDY